MKAYLIAVETVHDEAMFAEYRKQVVGQLRLSEVSSIGTSLQKNALTKGLSGDPKRRCGGRLRYAD